MERPVRVLDAAAARRWCREGRAALVAASAEIDALNVFPVADADTGTNLALTMTAAAERCADSGGDGAAAVLGAAAAGALRGARGSSGVILSRWLRGLADALGDPVGAADLAAGLHAAAAAARAAVAEPVEGTLLTVAAAAADGVATSPADLAAVVTAAADGARAALARTPEQLPVLADAGVVDAGGRGLVVLLDTLVEVVTGRPAAPAEAPAVRPLSAAAAGAGSFPYEVQYLLEAPAAALPGLRAAPCRLGDAVAVVSDGEVHNFHAHVADVGAAIEAGIEAGRPHRIRVTRFADAAATRPTATALVAVAPAGGLAELFRAAGAVVVEAGRSAAPDVLAAAARANGAERVALLPNDRELHPVAEAAADLATAAGVGQVLVVPTRSPMQGIAAVAVHDPERRFDADVVAMSAAAAATRHGAVTVADGPGQTSAGPCAGGDLLGLIDDDVAVVGCAVDDVARSVLDRLLIGGGELVTLVVDDAGFPVLGRDLADYLAATRPAVETAVHGGGPARFPVLVGVE